MGVKGYTKRKEKQRTKKNAKVQISRLKANAKKGLSREDAARAKEATTYSPNSGAKKTKPKPTGKAATAVLKSDIKAVKERRDAKLASKKTILKKQGEKAAAAIRVSKGIKTMPKSAKASIKAGQKKYKAAAKSTAKMRGSSPKTSLAKQSAGSCVSKSACKTGRALAKKAKSSAFGVRKSSTRVRYR